VRVLRVLIPLVCGAVLIAGASVAGVLAAGRIEAAAPQLTPRLTVQTSWIAAPGRPVPVVPPAQGSLAVDAVVGTTPARLVASDATTVRPIASVTKTMTALVILEVHPLSPGDSGPVLTMGPADVADYRAIAAAGGSYLPVSLGERLSERDILLGLMLPSANNLALTAARWVDGSVVAFVARLNARAAALGMVHTHFADPDGLDTATTSTAADLVILGERAVANDALVSVVSTASANLSNGTVVTNLDTLLSSEPGWLGIKTGWTAAAGGCLLFAARRTLPGTPPLTIVGAVLDQPPNRTVDTTHPELGGAFLAATAAVQSGLASYTAVRVGPGSIPVSGEVFGAWGAASRIVVRGADRTVLVRLGDALHVSVAVQAVTVPSSAGAAAGTVSLDDRGAPVGTWTLAVDGSLPAPSPWWQLLHG
jgi:D-alanyl-D-alanine carboxypeptidase (penicillin-binding protein 5/6)